MKTIGDLTPLEHTQLQVAQVTLEYAATRWVYKDDSPSWTILLQAARHFDEVVRNIGLDEYWKETIEAPQVCPSDT